MEVKNLILGVIIAVIFVMFCVYGTKLIYKEPVYENYCNTSMYSTPVKIPAQSCNISAGLDSKVNVCYSSGGSPIFVYDGQGCQKDVTCSTCNRDYDAADKDYSKNLFIISLVFGVIVIIIAFLLLQVPSVAGGLMLGSLFYIIYGTARYWRFMEDLLRFVILGIALLILIGIAYYAARRKMKR